jgi:hypothetical protein
MKLKEIIKLSAGLLGLDDVVSVLEDKNSANEYTSTIIERLRTLSNIVTTELSSGYIPLERIDEVKVVNNKISLTALQKRPTKIIEVMFNDGTLLDFTNDATTIYVQTTQNVKVKYFFIAENYKLTDDIGYTEQNISKVVLAYGICAEYCLTERRFDEAVMWHQRFVDGVKQKIMPKNVKTHARRWQ